MYAVGAEHPLKEPCVRILFLVAEQPGAFVTDAEALQELVHRYVAQRRWREGREVFQRFATLMRGRVEAVRAADVEHAAGLADRYTELSARDLIHAAVMLRLGVRQIVSADMGFGRIAEVQRLDPADVAGWGASLAGQ